MQTVKTTVRTLVRDLGPATPLLHAEAFLHIAKANDRGQLPTLSQIATATDQNATRISRIVDALTDSALIKPDKPVADRRRRKFKLTPRGQAVVEKLTEA